jgi:hypothetical protein
MTEKKKRHSSRRALAAFARFGADGRRDDRDVFTVAHVASRGSWRVL